MKDKMEDMSMDNMRKEYEELRSKDQMGQLDDGGRERLARLRERMGL
jgi:hypothetical protein